MMTYQVQLIEAPATLTIGGLDADQVRRLLETVAAQLLREVAEGKPGTVTYRVLPDPPPIPTRRSQR